jgi:enterochelin esterase family protein
VRPGYDPAAAWTRSLNEQSDPEHEPEWLAQQFALREKVPLRLYLETGRWTGPAKPYFPGNLTASRHMRDVLQAKGYDFTYAEYTGGHEFICWRGSLADGLVALIGGSR